MIRVGTRLGPYEVLAPLGAGGMGEVYKARHTRLGRSVAIKVLPSDLSLDEERLARFEQEARAASALNHPNILVVHDIGESDAGPYIAMELVEGTTLREFLASGPLPLKRAISIATQAADGLAKAHSAGIVHRDLKPENLMVSKDGFVKILDFGLAKLAAPSMEGLSQMLTVTGGGRRTSAGTVLGTVGYMSPEQATAKPVDFRSDQFSLGSIFYELLTGKRAFSRPTAAETLAAIIRDDPERIENLNPSVPEAVRWIVARCLAKDPEERYFSTRDLARELSGLEDRLSRGFFAGPEGRPAERSSRFSWPATAGMIALASLVLAAGGFLAGRRFTLPSSASGSAPAPIHSVVNLPEGTFLAGWASPVLAISRDGRKLAYVATVGEHNVNRLYVHHLDRGESQLVPDSDTAEGPFFSPDGQWVAFAVDVSLVAGRTGQLKKFSLVTGLTQPIAPTPDYGGGDWGPDGTILFTPTWTSGPWRVSSDGGPPDKTWEKVRVAGKDVVHSLAWPQLLPGGRSALVVDADASVAGEAAVLDLVSRELHPTGVSTLFARYAPTGHLLHLQPDASVHAASFDLEGRPRSGAGVAVLKDVAMGANGAPALAFSESGTLVYATGYLRASDRELLRLARLTFSGQVQPLPFGPDTFNRRPRASPDGRRIAVSTWEGTIWIYDISRGTRARLPRGKTAYADYLVWSPDGDRIAFVAGVEGHPGSSLLWQKADGSAPPEVLIGGGPEKAAMGFAPDGRSLLYREFAKPDGLWALDLFAKETPRRLLEGTFRWAAISPDGRWLAYDSPESGSYEVYARRFPSLDGKVQLSVGGGGGPQWAPDGRAVSYFVGDRVFRVRLTAGDTLEPSSPELLFEAKGMRSYSVAPDGKGFYATMRTPDSGIVRQLHLVTNWFEELKRLAPPEKSSD